MCKLRIVRLYGVARHNLPVVLVVLALLAPAQAQTIDEIEVCLNKVNTPQFKELYQHACDGTPVGNDLANIEECRTAINTRLSCGDFMGTIITAGKAAGQRAR